MSRLLFVCVLVSSTAHAQEDVAGGLFTAARHLPVISQSIDVQATGSDADVHVVQTFLNDGPDVGQADYQLHLPQGATVTRFGFWQGDRFLESTLKEKTEAESAHTRAATEGRATAILKRENTVHSFSVYPLEANALKKVEVTIRVPIEREMGRSEVRIPVDAFLDQPGPRSSVLVEIRADDPIAELGVDGAKFQRLYQNGALGRLALSTSTPVVIWWTEKGPPLSVAAEAVRLDDGMLATQLRVVLNDAGTWQAPWRSVHVLVDTSFSMRRRRGALRAFLDRVLAQSSGEVVVHAVAEKVVTLPVSSDAEVLVRQLFEAGAGHSARFDRMRCDDPTARCIVVTDAQIEGLESAHLPVTVFADAQEMTTVEGHLPSTARVYQPDVDAPARLMAIADEMVLPVVEVRSVTQSGERVQFPGQQAMRAAEGGVVRLAGGLGSLAPILVELDIAGRTERREVTPISVDAASPEGLAVRRAYFTRQLAAWMASYRREPDADLKKMIVAVSLREQIPTAFTALQVDDPELSMKAIKPGDPLLSVDSEPGLKEVLAWYPFGELRALRHSPSENVFTDRFLVPRGWQEKNYAIEVFKHFHDGHVEHARTWYSLDEQGPSVLLSHDGKGTLRIDPGAAAGDIASVLVHLPSGEVVTLSPVRDTWLFSTKGVRGRFSVVVRDRAGNRSIHHCELSDAGFSVESPSRKPSAAPALESRYLPLEMQRGMLSVRGLDGEVLWKGARHTFPLRGVSLRSLVVTATLERADGTFLVGTQDGDLLAFDCSHGEVCDVKDHGELFRHHPITGLVESGRTVIAGVLGMGLFELDGPVSRRHPVSLGTVFITALVQHGKDLWVGTATKGLWRIRGSRAVRSHFPHDHVARLTSDGRTLTIESGAGVFTHRSGDIFKHTSKRPTVLVGEPAFTSAVEWNGTTWFGSFEHGLYRGSEHIDVGLDARGEQINAMLASGSTLWLGTEGGLLLVENLRARKVLDAAVHDLVAVPEGVAVASSAGLYVASPSSAPRRIDVQSGVEVGRFFSVAWFDGSIYAGGMEGLYRFHDGRGEQLGAAHGFHAGWVTALLASGDRLLVGTYSDGVHEVRGNLAHPVEGLESQWVPPRAMRMVRDDVWIGGIGMPPVRVSSSGRVRAVQVPVSDVNDVLPQPGHVLLMTSDGIVRVEIAGDS